MAASIVKKKTEEICKFWETFFTFSFWLLFSDIIYNKTVDIFSKHMMFWHRFQVLVAELLAVPEV